MGAPGHALPPAGDGLADEALLGFLYQVPVGLLALDLSGHVAMANPMAVQWLMPLLPEARLDNLFSALAPQLPDLAQRVQALPAEPGHPGLQCRLEDPGPPRRLLDLQLMRLGPDRLMVSVSDVTLAEAQTQQRLAAHWQDAQRTDALTAMPNRRALLELLDQRLQDADAAGRHATGLALLLVNLDRFERINTRLGPQAGDAVLREVAQRLGQSLRQHDHVAAGTTARLGGDEFVVLLDGLAAPEAAQRVAQRLLHVLSQPCQVAGQTVHLSASIGVVATPHLAGTAETVLHDAALAMRQAKHAGGGVQMLFCPDTRDQALTTARLEHELRLALEPQQDQLFVVYQPIVPLQPGQAPGVEALVRWRHPQRGLVPPDAFIGLAESSGLIVPLGAQVLRSACRQFVAWQQALGERAPRKMSVNLSLAQLVDAGFVDEVAQALHDCGMPAKALQLEVTESMASREPGLRAVLLQLKDLGVTLALDDFGTGYSSLACLHQLPVDVVKIDRSFVSQLEHSTHHQVLVQATLMVAHSLGMATVAEGVETPAQEAALRRLGCGSAQGYLFSRPLPPAELAHWLVSAPSASPASSAAVDAG